MMHTARIAKTTRAQPAFAPNDSSAMAVPILTKAAKRTSFHTIPP